MFQFLSTWAKQATGLVSPPGSFPGPNLDCEPNHHQHCQGQTIHWPTLNSGTPAICWVYFLGGLDVAVVVVVVCCGSVSVLILQRIRARNSDIVHSKKLKIAFWYRNMHLKSSCFLQPLAIFKYQKVSSWIWIWLCRTLHDWYHLAWSWFSFVWPHLTSSYHTDLTSCHKTWHHHDAQPTCHDVLGSLGDRHENNPDGCMHQSVMRSC